MRRAVNGTELAVDVRGRGPAVLLCNGAGDPATQWDVLVPALLAAGCTVVTWDYRGVAPSAQPSRPSTMADMTGDAVGVLEVVGGGPAVVVGYSSGGWVACEAARARPDLVLAVATLGGIGPAPAIERRWLDDVVAAAVAAAGVGPVRVGRDHWPAWEEWVDGRPDKGLGAIGCPVQVIAFADDPYLTPEMAAAAVAQLRHGVLHVVDDCGHEGLWERPDVVIPLVVDFVSRHAHVGR